ncbi:MAG: sugar phosphate isomerase/epimerase [Lachnospiraceae bacterium]|nr:sugar phosphate isomerase/epimerase [Lachnospiraceae bacterium]
MFQLAVQLGGISKDRCTDAENLTDAYRLIQETGFDAVDANFDHLFIANRIKGHEYSEIFKPGRSDLEVAEYFKPWKIAADAVGIKNYQGHAPFPSLNQAERDDEYDAYLMDVLRKTIIGAAVADCHNLVIHGFYYKYEAMTSFEEDYERNLERYLSLAKTAKENGVTICVENLCQHKGDIDYANFLNNGMTAARFIDDLNREAGSRVFGFCLDVGHAILGAQDPKNFVISLGDRLQCLHVHDNNKLTDQHLAPFMGVLDWDRFLEGLKEIRYNKTLSFETFRFSRLVNSYGLLREGLIWLHAIGEAFQKRAAFEE